jgi:hypothetical protein
MCIRCDSPIQWPRKQVCTVGDTEVVKLLNLLDLRGIVFGSAIALAGVSLENQG